MTSKVNKYATLRIFISAGPCVSPPGTLTYGNRRGLHVSMHTQKQENPQIQYSEKPLLDLLVSFGVAGDCRSVYGSGDVCSSASAKESVLRLA
ncbi:hypothetical protein SCLCIDRAFT_1225343 [Scleroderma citrinum Foug A]|uniref:Uncharacterized protein n=1 Tax=Scleroderma citrinum Foug A TaxID=1036808 RepID=A0A0C3D2S3_9AGAM|nr:hypothetical protein SCLCIDRAFT_1225343 [Scleroderma citrinum Foug A]